MKRVTRVALIALCFVPSLAHAFPFNTFPRMLTHVPTASLDAERTARPAPVMSGLDFVLSTFDRAIIGKFREAWQNVGNGTQPAESVVLILRMTDGSFSARLLNRTNEYKRMTFGWHPATVAIVHTHPNSSPPRPEDADLTTADKYKVPIFTLTSRGMFVYDPATRKTTRVFEDMRWKEDAAWEQIRARLAGMRAPEGL